MSIKINNLAPDHDRYVVARAVDGELWYWESWPDRDAAWRVAESFDNGVLVDMGGSEDGKNRRP